MLEGHKTKCIPEVDIAKFLLLCLISPPCYSIQKANKISKTRTSVPKPVLVRYPYSVCPGFLTVKPWWAFSNVFGRLDVRLNILELPQFPMFWCEFGRQAVSRRSTFVQLSFRSLFSGLRRDFVSGFIAAHWVRWMQPLCFSLLVLDCTAISFPVIGR